MDPKITLLIDADDTLWENNKYFENVIDMIVSSILEYSSVPEKEIRDCIWKHEKIIAKQFGYGSESFAKALVEVVKETLPEHKEKHPEIFEIINREREKVYNHPINFFDGVKEHLKILSRKYDIILVTKGNLKEQSFKIERSGVKEFFKSIEILSEKNENAYEEIVKKYKLNKNFTWMIGNSPKSDINPSKKIGLNTIYVPYYLTWHLDLEDISNDGKETAILKQFNEIDNYISSQITKKELS